MGRLNYAEDQAGRRRRALDVLNAHLTKHEYVLGNCFTVADLSVACVLNWAQAGHFSLSGWPNVAAWLAKCAARQPAIKARGR